MATLLLHTQVQWLNEHSKTYRQDSGFYVQFCDDCGTAVPNRMVSSDDVCLPLGIVDGDFTGRLQAQVCWDSKWPWTTESPMASCCWQGLPGSVDALYQGLWGTQR